MVDAYSPSEKIGFMTRRLQQVARACSTRARNSLSWSRTFSHLVFLQSGGHRGPLLGVRGRLRLLLSIWMRCFEVVLLADRGEKPNLWSLICNYWTDKPDCRCAMAEFLGLLAFASLIAAQFLAVVVAYSQRFENDLPGGQRSATGMKLASDTSQGADPISSLPASRAPILQP